MPVRSYGGDEIAEAFGMRSRFFARPTRVEANAHRAKSAVALAWPHAPSFPGRALTATSTAATLVVVGMMSEGSSHRARGSRHNLVFGRSVVT